MDLMSILGLTCGFGVVYYTLYVGQMTRFLLNPEAIILIFGGTFGSVMISYPWSALRSVPAGLRMIIFPPQRPSPMLLMSTFVNLAEKARREGIDSLSDELSRLPHPYLADCVRMILDGLEPDTIRERCEQDILATQQRHQNISGIFKSAGTFAPIFGLLGTLIGVVQVLRRITDPAAMGASMAVAMTASFYGIFSANFLFLPIATKLTYYSEEDMLARELIYKGTLSLQKGESPWLMARKLESFLAYHMRHKAKGSIKTPA
ncbi:MAG TPA: hypothetical protein DEB40_04930 [Elusimicrobia bacterium]|nr:hypothetical protein [Elusimicrobiota bacterium]HBT61068.1 hypothetical protein [Elusimicrobiota bacterium]